MTGTWELNFEFQSGSFVVNVWRDTEQVLPGAFHMDVFECKATWESLITLTHHLRHSSQSPLQKAKGGWLFVVT